MDDPSQTVWAWRRHKTVGTKGSVNKSMNQSINDTDRGVCRAAPGFARVC